VLNNPAEELMAPEDVIAPVVVKVVPNRPAEELMAPEDVIVPLAIRKEPVKVKLPLMVMS
jgi:hypothetical protein